MSSAADGNTDIYNIPKMKYLSTQDSIQVLTF